MKNGFFINRNYFLLWLGNLTSQLGDNFYSIALAWWILEKTNSPSIMGFFLLVSVVPGLLFGLIAGTFVDKWNRKYIIVASDVIRGILVLIIVYLSAINCLEIWHVFVIGAGISLVTSFFEPSIQALIPQVVSSDKLKEANAMSQMVTGICTVLGPLLGALSISIFGLTIVFLLNGISYLLSAIMECYIQLNYKNEQPKSSNIRSDIIEGILFLKKKQEVLRVIIILTIAHFFLGCLMVILPFLANTIRGTGVNNLGYLQTILGVGLLLGSIFMGRNIIKSITEKVLIRLILIVGLLFTLLSILQFISIINLAPYLFIILLIGGFIACASVFWQSLIQLNTPENMTGRVFSISTLAANVSLPISYGLFGILLTHSSIWQLMLLSGCSLMLCSIFFIIQTTRVTNA